MVELLQTTDVKSNRREMVEGNPVPVVHLGSEWVYQGAMRLDANHYSSGATSALLVLDKFAGETQRVADLVSECYILGRFKRVYATDDKAGWPYLSPAETFQFRPASERWIARRHAPSKPERHFALPGWILVSASGSVGRPMLVTSRLEQFFLSHDLVRVVPSASMRSGYLYAYLASWIGQALLTKDQYGSAIKHLEAHHVDNIPVPLLSCAEMDEIADNIEHAYGLRDEANTLLDGAESELHRELGLPLFGDLPVNYLPVDSDALASFAVSATAISRRLDARTITRLRLQSYRLWRQASTLRYGWG